jgi:hypothetical protein
MLLPDADIGILLSMRSRGKGSEPDMTGSVSHRYLGPAADTRRGSGSGSNVSEAPRGYEPLPCYPAVGEAVVRGWDAAVRSLPTGPTVLAVDGPHVLNWAALVAGLSLYPSPLDGVDVRARSWVRRTHADLDEPLRRAVRAWLDGPDWPFERIDFAAG